MNDYTFHSEYGHLTKAILKAAADVIAFLVHHGEPNPLSQMERKNLPNRAERDGRVRSGLRAGVAYFSSAATGCNRAYAGGDQEERDRAML